MAVMRGLCLVIHVLKLPQAFMLALNSHAFRQVDMRFGVLFFLGVILPLRF